MKYHLDLFTPETWQTFNETGANITGFRARQQRLAEERVKSGDIFLCYLTRLSRWCGALEVELGPYFDDSPILDNPDPYHVRFKVKPIALLEPELAVPIRDPHVWQNLTITNQYDMGHPYWTGFFRSSLNTIEDSDGNFLLQLLNKQRQNPAKYPFTDRDRRQLARKKRVRTLDREVEVEVPVHEKMKPHMNWNLSRLIRLRIVANRFDIRRKWRRSEHKWDFSSGYPRAIRGGCSISFRNLCAKNS